MATLGDNQLNIQIRTQANTAGIKETKDSVEGLGASTSKLASAFAIGNIASNIFIGVTEKLHQGIDLVKESAKEWQSQQAQLDAALASTHGVAGVSKEDAIGYAEALSKSTPISREAALAGENMMLTFTNIHKNVFPQTTQAIADMATRMNHGLTPSAEQLSNTAIMVGKALNDPAVGLTRLQRVGVEFTAQQKAQIKSMQAAGDMTGAQTVILKELSKEFGGSASAAATTFGGKMTMLKNNLVDMGVNGLHKIATYLQETYNWYERNHRVINDVMGVVVAVGGAILVLVTIYKIWQMAIKTIELAQLALNIIMEMNPIILIMTAIIAIVILVALHWQQFKDIVKQVWADITGFISQHMGLILTLILGPIGLVIAHWSTVRDFFKGLVDDIVNFFKGLPERAIAAIGNIGQRIGNDLKGALHAIHIPGFAGGVQNFSGGLAVVGENGPELAYLPQGSNVYPNGTAPAGMTNSNSQTVTIGTVVLGDRSAVQAFFGKLDQDTMNVGKGLTANRGLQ